MPNGDELVSIRGLIEGFQRTPLREFKGKFTGFTTELVTRFEPARTYVNLNYEDIEVIKSTESYPAPIAQISIPLNKRRISQWTILADSMAKFISEGQDINNTIGMIHHMELTGGHMMWDRDKGEATPREAWEVMGLAGEGVAKAVDAIARALELLNDKNEQEWNQLVFQDPAIKADTTLMNDIIYRKFLPTQEAAGKATKDSNGVWHTFQIIP